MREQREVSIFESRVLINVFGYKTYELPGEWRRLHKEKLYDLCSSPDVINMIISEELYWRTMWPAGGRECI
jgi:hypothetical protein